MSLLCLGPVRLGSYLGLGPKDLGVSSRLGPFRLVETFRACAPCITSVLQ